MKIATLPARYPELGRIRLGEKGPKGQPVKGTNLRFSSNDRDVLEALAAKLGGAVEAWANGEQPWQLTTESPSVDVYLPPNPIDTAYERWGSGGCTRRCDGERATFLSRGPEGEFMDTDECLCLAEGRTPGDRKDPDACNVTVRLRLVIPDVPGVGVWVCTSHSVYAAMELPGQVAVLESALGGSTPLIPATFAIEHRSEKKPYEKYPRKYIVPVLRVRQSLAALAAGGRNGDAIGAGAGAIAAPRPALVAGAPAGVDPETGEIAARGAGADPAAGQAKAGATEHLGRAGADTPAAAAGEPAPTRRSPARPADPTPPAGQGGAQPKPFIRTIRNIARTRGLTDEQLRAIVSEELAVKRGTDAPEAGWGPDDIEGPAEANVVLDALNKLAAAS